MVVYWIFFIAFSVMAMLEVPRPAEERGRLDPPWLVAMVCVAGLIGLRWETGGDWFNYVELIERVRWVTLGYALTQDDPAYNVMNWLAARTNFGMRLISIVSGIVMAFGLSIFCRNQPRPWLALTLAVPYLIIVLGMGYIRQGILQNSSVMRYAAVVGIGALFHSSAAIFIPLAAAIRAKGRALTVLWLVPVAAVSVYALRSRVSLLWTNYVDAEYNSGGALIRVLITAFAGATFLLFRKRYDLNKHELALWTWLAIIAVGFLLLLRVLPSSTAVDRIALYWLPLQLFVFSRLPEALSVDRQARRLVAFAVVAAYALTLWIWLNYAENAWQWVPYTFRLFPGSA